MKLSSKIVFSAIIFCLLIFISFWASAQTTTVTFKVNMNYLIEQDRFDPSTEFVDLAGSFNNWGDPGYMFSDDSADGIYTTVATLKVGATVEFKARINGEWAGREEFPGGGPNRSYTVEETGIVEFWYNDEIPEYVLDVQISSSGNSILPGESIRFIDQSSGNPVAWEWTFPGGSPSSSTEQSPLVSYSSEGNYDVTLKITNDQGEELSESFAEYVKVGDKATYWWNETVFYEIFVRSFKDSDGDGRGDFKGLIDKLDYLNDGDPKTHDDLGVTGIWLMPIQQSPSYHGYDVIDYREIEKDYGSNEDFKLFMEEAHSRGIRVIIDLVMNHSSDEIPWFQESLNPESDYRDWYIWRDQDPGGSGPWGQDVWHSRNGDYYYGLFWSGMPDLNYNSPEVKTEMFDIARFWLEEMNVDGFRLDAVKYIYENDNSLEDTEETFQFWKDFRRHYKSINPESFSVGEAWTSTDKVVKYVENEGLDYCFEFDLAGSMLNAVNSQNASGLSHQAEKVMAAYPYLQFGTFLTNHDINRVMDQLGYDESKARLASELLLTLPGIPYLYYGEEIGMTGTKPDEDIRTPMQWSGNEGAGFTDGSPWHRINGDYNERNVTNQQSNYHSLWHNYRKMIALRNHHQALQTGNYRTIMSSNDQVYAFLRQLEEENILIVSNLSVEALTTELSLAYSGIDPGNYQLIDLLGHGKISLTVNENSEFEADNISIPPQTTLVYKFFQGSAPDTRVTFQVDMNPMISAGAFDPDSESVDIVAGFNDFGASQTDLSDENNDGIYTYEYTGADVGNTLSYKYRINGVDDDRAEYPNSDFYREYLIFENENIVFNVYQSDLITSIQSLGNNISVYPNPSPGQFFIRIHNRGYSRYQLIDMSGTVRYRGKINPGTESITIDTALSSGIYLLQVQSEKHIITKRLMIK